ncbi:hypothetical protein [Serratia marcescens]|uniref:hypothetical protein n=1 Tax=Serratia marcescens TaxID=615 RepID=UPI00404666DC
MLLSIKSGLGLINIDSGPFSFYPLLNAPDRKIQSTQNEVYQNYRPFIHAFCTLTHPTKSPKISPLRVILRVRFLSIPGATAAVWLFSDFSLLTCVNFTNLLMLNALFFLLKDPFFSVFHVIAT